MSGISIVIPALDEEGALPAVIAESREAAVRAGLGLDLILVDDGSRDGTPAIMEAACAADPGHVRVVRHERPRGCHPSTLDGFALAREDWVIFFPADGQVPPGVLGILVQTAEFRNLDAVVGVRARRKDPLFRRLVSRFYARLLSLLVGLSCRDVDSSTLYRRAALQAVLPALRSDSAMIAAEILWRIQQGGGRVGEAEIAHRARTSGRAKGINLKDALRVPVNLMMLARLRKSC